MCFRICKSSNPYSWGLVTDLGVYSLGLKIRFIDSLYVGKYGGTHLEERQVFWYLPNALLLCRSIRSLAVHSNYVLNRNSSRCRRVPGCRRIRVVNNRINPISTRDLS